MKMNKLLALTLGLALGLMICAFACAQEGESVGLSAIPEIPAELIAEIPAAYVEEPSAEPAQTPSIPVVLPAVENSQEFVPTLSSNYAYISGGTRLYKTAAKDKLLGSFAGTNPVRVIWQKDYYNETGDVEYSLYQAVFYANGQRVEGYFYASALGFLTLRDEAELLDGSDELKILTADFEFAADETPAPTATPAFSPYRKVKEAVTVTLPIFTEAERAMGLSINVSQNELITVSDIGSAFLIESRRFGHGVGMSQRGAEQMARQYGMTYEQILAFYYPGMGLVSYDTGSAPLPTLNAELMATPAPTPSPTPRPTLMPVSTNQMPEGAYLAIVSNIDEDSTLNLREQPNTSAEVIRRLYKNQPLIVLSVSKDGWAHVKTDVMEGYVRSEYLQAEKDS